ncbi:Crp/Fnr family transcriptional regulator [Salmonirosea aquatica]|uniref:Cyclic nucleotide-binding domain-containing protein n=1 Tax=Salmonirosea aquatica TaxID=2654236 RepID=A0A7C9BE74_9BACT|nr:hypothetical protein [Cytophagaceae bacterium SJW1-29]
MELLPTLVKITHLPEKELMPVLNLFESIDVPAKTVLLVPGKVCSQVWFVGSGSLRAYYQLEERKRTNPGMSEEKITREVTNWLIPTGGLHTAMRSFSQQVPTFYYVETLEASRLFTLSYPNYRLALRLHPEVVWKIFEYVIVMADLRLHISNLRYPEDRLRVFELTYPGTISQLPVHIQASYLNIDPNTLSRLRAKRQ